MKTRLEQVLDRHLNGRGIAVWGSPTRSLLRVLKAYNHHIAGDVDPAKHYVVAVNYGDMEDFQTDAQSKPFKPIEDYLAFDDEGGELPFEWECHGVKIGRQTYFGEGFAGACAEGYIGSIGHFTSINHTADMGVNHQLDMVFTSDDIAHFFTADNKKQFRKRLASNPQSPYNKNKPPITIGSDVYIGANAFVNVSKVTDIGDGAIIGAGAVVLENVPPYAVAVGVPAKVKRYRFTPEMIECLLRVKWWEWSIEQINANADALMSPEIFWERFGNIKQHT
jgi:aminocyclitol acetyltransferase